MTAPLTEPLFYATALDGGGDVTLSGDEAHHVTVQRLRAGDAIALFDGRGQVARGQIAAIARGTVRIEVRLRYCEPPPAPRLELYSAVPKGERAAVLLDMATQLGMTCFTPLRWRRGTADPGAGAQTRWQRICIEACKQSRRTHVPEIAPSADTTDAAARANAAGDCLLVAHPGKHAVPVLAVESRHANRIALFVGPEGGLTDDEIEMLHALGARFVHLGTAILRIETAAVALLAALGARNQ